jgi:hypothetical protein
MRSVYEVCASAISRLLPKGGKVIDLGAGAEGNAEPFPRAFAR